MSLFLQELKKANQELEAKVNELTSTCTQQKEQLSKLATVDSGSEVTIDFLLFLLSVQIQVQNC
jgi:hypothetical protein